MSISETELLTSERPNPSELSQEQLIEVLIRYYWDELTEHLKDYPATKSIPIDYYSLDHPRYPFADLLEENPDIFLSLFHDAVYNMTLPVDVGQDVVPRIYNFPEQTNISSFRSDHLMKFVSIPGVVKKVSKVKPMIVNAAFYCMRCEHITYIPQTGSKFTEPHECENEVCGRKGPFKTLVDKSSYRDVQIIEIQENPEDIEKSQPETLICYAYDDMVQTCKPGDKILVNGVLQSRQEESSKGKKPFFKFLLDVNNIIKQDKDFDEIELTPEDEEQVLELSRDPNIKDRIAGSMATSIYGYQNLKKAIAVQLFSGVSKTHEDGAYTRGDIHVLAVSDPGMSKSKLLNYAATLSPKSIITSGKGNSAAGLTASVIKNDPDMDDQFALEAGALPLADKGLCCIDELDKMSEEDRSALHDAMAQQKLPINKANIHLTLSTRTSVLGAANPKYGRFDEYESLSRQVQMAPSLISRFDLIFLMLDKPDDVKDRELSDHIIATHIKSSARQNLTESEYLQIKQQLEEKSDDSVLSFDLLQKYISYARHNVVPVLPVELKDRITEFWMNLRHNKGDDSIPVTPRKLESIIRVSEAFARMRLDNRVNEQDVQDAIDLIQESLKQSAVDPQTGKLDTDILETGTSNSQRSKIKDLYWVIYDLEDANAQMGRQKGVSIHDIYEEAQKEGISNDQVDEAIGRMRKQGDLMEVDTGTYIIC
ncbi:MCM family protein [Methanohalobium evestigatum Z-7303]|uniref:DNA helicase n=1 Tax=Methanohalobium evestigatum (strain ATCC BAA-1072 / DSM 3721 / NBRC 107634 / OCM 161 / Z-7303) TaxID=644295 RepID=D7E6T1_METEZ|nr:MCM family protein [Methanohalobium evestigatum Z-7303]